MSVEYCQIRPGKRKRKYRTKKKCYRQINRTRERVRRWAEVEDLYPYPCPICSTWHLTSMPPEEYGMYQERISA